MKVPDIVFLLIVYSTGCFARTDEEGKTDFVKKVMTCTKKHPVDLQELVKLEAHIVPTKKEVKCLLACAYRLDGVMDEKGMYILEGGYKLAELGSNGDKKRLDKGKKLADTCAKANEEKVSDRDEGCERAALMFKCMITNAPKLGFKI